MALTDDGDACAITSVDSFATTAKFSAVNAESRFLLHWLKPSFCQLWFIG
jgi:hypothetical protein